MISLFSVFTEELSEKHTKAQIFKLHFGVRTVEVYTNSIEQEMLYDTISVKTELFNQITVTI